MVAVAQKKNAGKTAQRNGYSSIAQLHRATQRTKLVGGLNVAAQVLRRLFAGYSQVLRRLFAGYSQVIRRLFAGY